MTVAQRELIRDLWVYLDANLPLNVEGDQLCFFIDDIMEGFSESSLTFMTATLVGEFFLFKFRREVHCHSKRENF